MRNEADVEGKKTHRLSTNSHNHSGRGRISNRMFVAARLARYEHRDGKERSCGGVGNGVSLASATLSTGHR